MYSLIVTAKMNDVDPQAWLAEVLARINDLPQTRLDELLPWEWKRLRQTTARDGNPATVETHGRHDPGLGIRATPIAEAMLALVLMDHALRHRAQCGDVVCATPRIPGAAPRD